MARLSKVVVEQRENFIKEFFKKNPTGTAAKAQEELKASGIPGGAMRPGRVYELKREVRGTTPTEQASATVADILAAAPVTPSDTVVLNPLTGEPIEPVKA